jgi:2-polyprenyl-6-methoxyphenol hydroxylase-like FAD-dependent oxidoreductase
MGYHTDVLIAGGGPTGLMLAAELRLAGASVTVLDGLPGRTGQSRAGGMHARSMEVLDQRGVLEPFLAAGRPLQAGHFSALRLDFSRFATRYPYTLVLLQDHIERLLEDWVGRLGVRVGWDSEVVGLAQDAAGVDVELAGGRRLRARWLVGCDGGRSAVRKLAGIGFPGTDATVSTLLGDVVLDDPPPEQVFQVRREHGQYSVLAFEPGWYRIGVQRYDAEPGRDVPVTLDELRADLLRVAGTDFGMREPRWLSRYGDAARQADRYREGRILLAGDAAHIHYPAGGQGLNTGVQDAANLGWKLGAVLRGDAPDTLLDSYQSERHPVAARVLSNTRAQVALGRPGPHTDALRAVLADLIELPEVNDRLAGMISALDLRYDLPGAPDHSLVGRRMPDLDLTTEGGATRVCELLHRARPVVLNLADEPDQVVAEVASHGIGAVELVRAGCPKETPPASVVLIRPDGYVGWAV